MPAHRYGLVPGPSWQVPASGELLSSWLHLLAHANGVPPRYFGAVLGSAGEAWSAQLDRRLPEAVRRLPLDHTSICPEELDGHCPGPNQLSVLRLRQRTRPQDARTSTAQPAGLQYCPVCLRDDEVLYFRRSWTLGTRVTCFHHGCRLRDRCPSCGQGLAPFKQARIVSQQNCAFCEAPLAKPTGPVSQGARRLERLIDDLLRLDTIGRAQDDRKSLDERLARCPVPISAARSTIPHPSHRFRHDFFRRLSESRIGIESQKAHGPPTRWTRLANAAENHSGLVGVLADRLSETSGLEQAAPPNPPDLIALLQAAIRLH